MSQENLAPTTSTEPIEVMFPELRYDRVCRTSHSEAYLLSEGDDPFGRIDLHQGHALVGAGGRPGDFQRVKIPQVFFDEQGVDAQGLGAAEGES